MEIYEHRIEEIIGMMRDNLLLLYRYNDNALTKLKKSCNKSEKIKEISQSELTNYTKEALYELLKVDYLYDFRDME